MSHPAAYPADQGQMVPGQRSNHRHPPLVGGEVRVRYFAGARAAAGVGEDLVAPGMDLEGLIAELAARHGKRLADVLTAASFLVDGVACHDRQVALPPGATVDVLPPFAGG